MASKYDDFMDEVKQHKVRKVECAVCFILKKLTKDEAAQVQSAMDREELSSNAIRKALIRRDAEPVPSIWSMNRHRRNECQGRRGF